MLEGNAPSYQAYETCVLLLNYSTINLVQPVGIEPTSSNFQSAAMTTSAKVAYPTLDPSVGDGQSFIDQSALFPISDPH